jgi:Trypsin-like peptidase domain
MPMKTDICTIVPLGQNGFRPVVFGMGFLISEREILTCSHVILAALGQDWRKGKGTVRLCFPFVEGEQGFLCIDGSVDRDRWFAPGPPAPGKPSDIAVINLEEDAPETVKRAELRDHRDDSRVKIYGFRMRDSADGPISHPEGELMEGTIVGPLPGGRGQFDGVRETGATIEKGFSGSGVYDPRQDAVVGMIAEADKEKPRKIAQFIDVPSLRQALGKKPATPRPVIPESPWSAPTSLLGSARRRNSASAQSG